MKTKFFHGVPTYAELREMFDKYCVEGEALKVPYLDGYYIVRKFDGRHVFNHRHG